MQATATLIVLALARNTDRIVSIYVATPKVAKASTIRVAVASIIAGVIALTFANGNTAQELIRLTMSIASSVLSR
jgi:hypothetical protein